MNSCLSGGIPFYFATLLPIAKSRVTLEHMGCYPLLPLATVCYLLLPIFATYIYKYKIAMNNNNNKVG